MNIAESNAPVPALWQTRSVSRTAPAQLVRYRTRPDGGRQTAGRVYRVDAGDACYDAAGRLCAAAGFRGLIVDTYV